MVVHAGERLILTSHDLPGLDVNQRASQRLRRADCVFTLCRGDLIIDRTRVGLRRFVEICGPPKGLVIAGGVASNLAIRSALERFGKEAGLRLVMPPPALCTDNGAMIAWTGIERLRLGLTSDLSFAPRARWPLDADAARVHNAKA